MLAYLDFLNNEVLKFKGSYLILTVNKLFSITVVFWSGQILGFIFYNYAYKYFLF